MPFVTAFAACAAWTVMAAGEVRAQAEYPAKEGPAIITLTPGVTSPVRRSNEPDAGSRPRIIQLTPPEVMPVPINEIQAPTPPSARVSRPATKVADPTPEAPEPVAGSTEATGEGPQDYEYCNRTSYAITVAVGVRQAAQWMTRGWWTIYPGACRTIIKGRLMPTAYFTFARSHFAHHGATRAWGGNHTLCVGRGQFQATSDGTGICPPGLEPQGFARIETGGRTSWKTTLTESMIYKNNEIANTAGLQRLLGDLGLYLGPPDGDGGQKFRDAAAAARARYAIAEKDDYETFFGKLLAEAAKVQAQVGLTFCNRSNDALWVALGQDLQGRKASKGWWRIQTGQCEKVIKERLAQRYLFAHASNDRGGTDGIWGGAYPFCTKDAAFEMDSNSSCESRGGVRTGFFAIDTQGRAGAVYNFGPQQAAQAPAR